METKICAQCAKSKPFSSYWRCEGTPDGLQYKCAQCLRQNAADMVGQKAKTPKTPQEKASVIRSLIRGSRKRAKKDGIVHTIQEKDITFVDTCPVLGLALVLNRGRVGPDSFSLDRKDPDVGYIPGNCFIISWAANQAKDRMSREDVLSLLAYMES